MKAQITEEFVLDRQRALAGLRQAFLDGPLANFKTNE